MEREVLEKLHSTMFEIYEEIARICDKHGLNYFVVGGTLIGAVVHKGYIPWDDDLDIAMPREDYEKFLKIAPQELGKRFMLHHTSTDKKYWLSFAKVRMNGTVFLEEKRKNVDLHAGIYVDVFPFDYAPDCNTGKKAAWKWKWINWINNYIYAKTTGLKVRSKSSALLTPLFSLFSIYRLNLIRDKIVKSFDKGERKYFLDSGGGRSLDNSYFKVESMLPVGEMPFGEKTVKVPSNPHSYLVQLYTERYLVIPPKEKQITHNPLLIRFEDGTEYHYEI